MPGRLQSKFFNNPLKRHNSRVATLREVISCTSDYDPDALPVAKANEVIRSFVKPVSGIEKLRVREALGRVFSRDIVSRSMSRRTTTRRWTAMR